LPQADSPTARAKPIAVMNNVRIFFHSLFGYWYGVS
jgi:hypothetical protein